MRVSLCLLALAAVCITLCKGQQDSDRQSQPVERSRLPRDGSHSVEHDIIHAEPTTSGNDTILSSTKASGDEVSWQSAVWGLIALSTLAMIQRSGADRFPSSDSLSPARTSPFVCIADMVVALLWLGKGKQLGMDFRSTLRWQRQQMGLVRGSTDRDLVQGIPVVTTSLFVLGPLPQAIKMFSMTGLPWTKTWAILFFTAWMVEIVIRFVAGIPGRSQASPSEAQKLAKSKSLISVSRMIHQAAFLTQAAVWLWILVSICVTYYVRFFFGALFVASTWAVLVGIGGFAVWALGLFSLAYCLQTLKSVFNWTVMAILYVSLFFAWSVSWFYFLYGTKWSSDFLDWLFKICEPFGFVIAVVALVGCLYFFIWVSTGLLVVLDTALVVAAHGGTAARGKQEVQSLSHQRPPTEAVDFESATSFHPVRNDTAALSASEEGSHLSPLSYAETSSRWQRVSDRLANLTSRFLLHSRAQTDDQRSRALAIAFSLANLIITVLYYRFRYTPGGTVKPSWTEILG